MQGPNTEGWYKPTGEGPTPAIRLVGGLRHVPYEDRLRQLNLLSLTRWLLRSDLIVAFNIFKGEVDLNPSDFYLCPTRAGLRGHTYRSLQGPSLFGCLFGSCREILEQIGGTSSRVTLSVCLQKTFGPSMIQNFPCSTCVNSALFHRHFSF